MGGIFRKITEGALGIKMAMKHVNFLASATKNFLPKRN
jgi:hypothetical protein